MIGKLSVQLYPYSKLGKNHLLDAIKIAKEHGIYTLEGTSEILNSLQSEKVINRIDCIHISNWHQLVDKNEHRKKIVPSLIHEKDFVFPISLMQKIVSRNMLYKFGNMIFSQGKRRIFFNNLSNKSYRKKEYWVELTSWLNAQNTKITLHNHAMELENFQEEGESPWEIIHRYCVPKIRFQFDPQNIKDKTSIEEILIKFNQRIDSIHIDMDDTRISSDQKEFIIEYCKIIDRPIDLVIEQSKPNLERLGHQITTLQKAFT